ncbi:MAG: hypothetical protein ACJ779_06965 [Chloroflexota bacterium]
MQLFLVAFQQPIPFGISAAIVILMIFIILRSAMAAEGGAGWVKKYVTNPNGKYLFAFLFIGWAIFFGVALQLVPHSGANSPYGGIGLLALFSGFFIMMGFLWSVIGE